MSEKDPLLKPKEAYIETISRIKAESSVGIDAQYTHAVIIEYLKQLSQRIERLEKLIEQNNS